VHRTESDELLDVKREDVIQAPDQAALFVPPPTPDNMQAGMKEPDNE
jgi:hypothetical protein